MQSTKLFPGHLLGGKLDHKNRGVLTPQFPLKNPVQWTVGQEEAKGTKSPTAGFSELNGLKHLHVHVRAQAL